MKRFSKEWEDKIIKNFKENKDLPKGKWQCIFLGAWLHKNYEEYSIIKSRNLANRKMKIREYAKRWYEKNKENIKLKAKERRIKYLSNPDNKERRNK